MRSGAKRCETVRGVVSKRPERARMGESKRKREGAEDREHMDAVASG